jgi:hypothetical protein
MSDTEKFRDEESKRRFEMALRGARLAGHKPMETLTAKKTKKTRKPKKKAKTSA